MTDLNGYLKKKGTKPPNSSIIEKSRFLLCGHFYSDYPICPASATGNAKALLCSIESLEILRLKYSFGWG